MQNSPVSPRGSVSPVDRVGDADLDVRVGPPDRRRLVLERVAAQRLRRHRRRLGHAVTDGHVDHVHAVDALLHHLDRARRPGHHAGAQARQVELGEARWPSSAMNIVGTPYSAVQRSACTASSTVRGSNASFGITIVAPWRGAAEVAHHHAEAVVEGHRDAQPVGGREALQRGDEEARCSGCCGARGWRPSGSRWCPTCTGC